MQATSIQYSDSMVGRGRVLHGLAVVLALAVFPLIIVGAGVTSKEVGMAFPDGFTANGYFWTNPPGWFAAENTRWEHGHRLLGRTVGILAIMVAIGCWRRGGSLRVLGTCTLLAIVIQGVFGAFRVNKVSTSLAMVHGVFGQICFCLACSTALVTSRTWTTGRASIEARAAGFLQKLCIAGVICVFVQLALGAAQRHFPSNPALVAHIFWAIVVGFVVGWTAMWVMGQHPGRHLLSRLGQAAAALMLTQLFLGGATFVVVIMGASKSPFVLWAVPSAHVAVGALLLACLVLLTLSAHRFLRPTPNIRGADAAAS